MAALEDDEALEGEFVELPDEEESEVEDTPDGGAIVRLDETSSPGSSKFLRNLADTLPDSVLQKIGARLQGCVRGVERQIEEPRAGVARVSRDRVRRHLRISGGQVWGWDLGRYGR